MSGRRRGNSLLTAVFSVIAIGFGIILLGGLLQGVCIEVPQFLAVAAIAIAGCVIGAVINILYLLLLFSPIWLFCYLIARQINADSLR